MGGYGGIENEIERAEAGRVAAKVVPQGELTEFTSPSQTANYLIEQTLYFFQTLRIVPKLISNCLRGLFNILTRLQLQRFE